MRTLLLFAAMLAGLSPLSAQTVQTVPAGYLKTNGNHANSWPWNNRFATGHRCMWIYDSSHFKSAGPILIQRLRWRTYSTYSTWAGGTHPKVTINLSTSPLDYKKASATYASNHGKDKKTVFSGTVTVTSNTHKNGRWYVDIALKTPFLYDPSKGDLTIDYIRAGGVNGTFVPVDTLSDSTTAWRTKSNRIQSSNTATSPKGIVGPYAAICEITWVPRKGLYSAFTASPTAGSGPLKVQFKDQTFSSAAGGVKTWAWDLDGDSKTDSTLKNPVWTYKSTGKTAQYSVTLTTTDGVHPSSKLTRTNFITVDPPPVADFTADKTVGATPLIVKFTDKSVGAKSWAWDFNNDKVVDSVAQNPVYVFAQGGSYTVTLSVKGVGGTHSVTKKDYITAIKTTAKRITADRIQFQFNEVRGDKAGNTASKPVGNVDARASSKTWMTDSGRASHKGPEPGAGALGNSSYIDTGWAPSVSKDLTIEWWIKNRTASGTSFGYFFGDGTFRCFTGGLAGSGLWFRGTNIGDIKMKAGTNVQGKKGAWVHVALVIDGTAKKATWYINGVVNNTQGLTAALSYNSTRNMTIGANNYGNVATAFYDMDDFRIHGKALTQNQIWADMIGEVASAGRFEAGCAGTLGTPLIGATGIPTPGNSTFVITVDKAENGRPGVLILGAAAKKLANVVPLPITLGALLKGTGTCKLHVDPILMVARVGNGGKLAFPAPLPASLAPGHLYAQWVGFGTTGAVSAGLDINMQK